MWLCDSVTQWLSEASTWEALASKKSNSIMAGSNTAVFLPSVILLYLVSSVMSSDSSCDLKVIAEWSMLQFNGANNTEPKHNIISSARIYRDRMFLSVPRWKVKLLNSIENNSIFPQFSNSKHPTFKNWTQPQDNLWSLQFQYVHSFSLEWFTPWPT